MQKNAFLSSQSQFIEIAFVFLGAGAVTAAAATAAAAAGHVLRGRQHQEAAGEEGAAREADRAGDGATQAESAATRSTGKPAYPSGSRKKSNFCNERGGGKRAGH